jgi:hypothetical protein
MAAIPSTPLTPVPPVAPKILSSITWRFDTSSRLNKLLNSKAAWYVKNHDQFWVTWYNNIFNLKTANNFGCAVWAYILDVPINVLGLRNNYRLWAFGPTRSNFDTSTDPIQNPSSGNFPSLSQSGAITSIQEAIWALRLKYYVHTSPRDVLSINKLLNDVFNSQPGVGGMAYIQDGQDMTMTYVFTFPISLNFQQAMIDFDLLPKVSGVKLIINAP